MGNISDTTGRRPLKIAMLLNDFPKISQTFVLSQITDLIDRGHDISIFSRNAPLEKVIHRDIYSYKLFRRWNIIPTRQGKFNTMKKRWGHRVAACLLKHIIRFRTFRYLWEFQKRPLDALSAFRCWQTRYDVIHAHFGPAGHWGLFLKEIGLLEGPLTVSIRGYDVPQKDTAAREQLLWDNSVFLQPSSQSLADSLTHFGCPQEKCRIIYSGINLERFPARASAPVPDHNIRILSVGRLVEKKGLIYTLEAFSRVLEKYPRALYTIVGDGPLKAELQEKSQRLGISRQVHFHGPGSQPEILKFLQESHIFWAASVTSSKGDVEGDLNTIKEALAVGVPTIATRHGGIPEIIDHEMNGLLVPERDPIALASSTQLLLEHPERWPSFALNGREKIKRMFEHSHLTDELETIYYEMAAPREQSTTPSAP